VSRFGQWLGLTHTQRYHAHYHSTGEGHLYQGRFKSFPVQSDEHFLSVCHYVERNAYSARLCDAPDQWRFCSLWRWRFGSRQKKAILSPWPIPRRPGWLEWVTEPLTDQELKQLQLSIQRDAPYGEETWVESTSRRLGLESTMRSRGRPKKLPK
jgi:putative transposase